MPNIRDLMASGQTDRYPALRGRKPGGSGLKGLNSKGILDKAKKMYADDATFGIHLHREMQSEAPHIPGGHQFEKLTSTQQKNVAMRLHSHAQQLLRSKRFKDRVGTKESYPGSASKVIEGGGPGSGRHATESLAKKNGFQRDKEAEKDLRNPKEHQFTHKDSRHTLITKPSGAWEHFNNKDGMKPQAKGNSSSSLGKHLATGAHLKK